MKAKRPCFVCKDRPARRLKTGRVHYKYVASEPIFCSVRCAADYALHAAVDDGNEGAPRWCDVHKWTNGDMGHWCYECPREGA